MRGHSRGCNRGEFYYNIKRFLLQPSGRAEAKSLRPLGIQFFFGKGERVLTRSTNGSVGAFHRINLRGAPKLPLSSIDRRTTVFGTSVLISRHGERTKGRERGEVFTLLLESGTTPPTTRLHIHREKRGVNRNPSLSLSPLLLFVFLPFRFFSTHVRNSMVVLHRAQQTM